MAQISAPAAMAIYSAVGSGMLALTGIVFSLAFVMVQFSATAYSPRCCCVSAAGVWKSVRFETAREPSG